MARYRLDPTLSRFSVQAFAGGLLSFVAHSPTFAVRDFTGAVEFEGGRIAGLRLSLAVKAESLDLVDRVSAGDRAEIEGRMRREVLEVTIHPEITYQSGEVSFETVAQGRHRLRVGGQLSLHGVVRPHTVEAELVVFDDGVRLRGETVPRMSDYRIGPVVALGGAIRLKDELKVSFDLAAVPVEAG
jgi:polyisoprenoid-binding protein YceI